MSDSLEALPSNYVLPEVNTSQMIEFYETVWAENKNGITAERVAKKCGFTLPAAEAFLVEMKKRADLRGTDDHKTYELSARFINKMRQVMQSRELLPVALPELDSVRDLIGEAVLLGSMVKGKLEAICYTEVQSDDWQLPQAQEFHLHCTAMGKVLLAHLTDKEVDKHLGPHLERQTSATITDRAVLNREIETVRKLGYAVNDEEDVAFERTVGVPVYDASDRCIAALGVSGPRHRITNNRIPGIAKELRKAARRIQGAMRTPNLSHRAPAKAVALTDSPQPQATSLQWHPRSHSFYWLDLATHSLCIGSTEKKARVVQTFDAKPTAFVHTKSGTSVVAIDAELRNLQTGKSLMFDATIETATAGANQEIWTLLKRDYGHSLTIVDGEGNATEQAFLPNTISSLVYHPQEQVLFGLSPVTHEIYSFTLSSKRLSTLISCSPAKGRPSALALGANGNLFVTFEDSWTVVEYTPAGAPISRHRLPVNAANSICFGGEDGKNLALTTRETSEFPELAETAPLNGHVVQIRLNEH